MFDHVPPRRPRPGMTIHPRKVRGGLRIAWAGVREPTSWVARRLMELARQSAAPEDYSEGLDYARRGQTVGAEIAGVVASATIQGRSDRPYATALQFTAIPEVVWAKATETMAGEAIYAAGLLAGEVPDRLDSLFVACGSSLAPRAEDVRVSCTCGHTAGWCKHACTLAAILAERLGERPFAIFELRGQRAQALLDALRGREGGASIQAVARPVYEAHVPDAPSARGQPLDECIDRYWDAGPELAQIATPIEPPKVTHPLLRRLGPSPFKEWRFPLVGLLATCYDIIGAANLDREEEDDPPPDSP
ncbi:MAG: hypothetical protein IT431_17745 [Phycisphaerales bacterium]|nr:hypothetical protein [Phycisphaerales bacterium]